MHIHIGILPALQTFAYVIILGFFWRWFAHQYSDHPIAQAMAFIY